MFPGVKYETVRDAPGTAHRQASSIVVFMIQRRSHDVAEGAQGQMGGLAAPPGGQVIDARVRNVKHTNRRFAMPRLPEGVTWTLPSQLSVSFVFLCVSAMTGT